MYKIIKRAFDIIISIVVIILLIPISIVIKIISIFMGDYNSIFFVQKRIGKNGKLFKLYKFRTMIPDAEKELSIILKNNRKLRLEYKKNKKLSNDPRVTKLGKILRKTNIDELPQFINVLLNDMSIVGNRPYLPNEVSDIGKYYSDIILVKPGITGAWQISNVKNFKYRCKLESSYYKNMNLFLDIKIIFQTFKVIFSGLRGKND